MRKLGPLVLCVALAATACGDSRTTETESGAAIRWIDIDAKTNRFNVSFLAYFPEKVTVRPGDAVRFRSVWNGEPHMVTMGTLVNALFAQPPPPEPPPIPRWSLGESHILPANVGRPCYLDEGPPPSDPGQACPTVEQPPFNGRQSYYSSGFLPESARFTVELAEDIAPGSYRFFCNFHGPRMSGEISVVERGAEIPPQSELDDAANEKLRAFVDGTLPEHARRYEPFERARSGSFPWPSLASFETHEGIVKVLEFVPFTLKAKVDERVSWRLNGTHTIAFDAPQNAKPPATRILTTGETELKQETVNENRSPEPPLGAPPEPIVLEAPPYADGFLSSGILHSPQEGLVTYAVRFTEPGSYRYECLIHPRMSGLITVSV